MAFRRNDGVLLPSPASDLDRGLRGEGSVCGEGESDGVAVQVNSPPPFCPGIDSTCT